MRNVYLKIWEGDSHHRICNMSIEDASKLLWQQAPIPATGFSAFKRIVLQEISARNGLVVGRSGKSGNTVKSDYVKALFDFVSQMLALAAVRRYWNSRIKRSQIEIERWVTSFSRHSTLMLSRFVPPSVKVRVYKSPKDWHHLLEQVVVLEGNGDLCLDRISRPEAQLGECRVSFLKPQYVNRPNNTHRPSIRETTRHSLLINRGTFWLAIYQACWVRVT